MPVMLLGLGLALDVMGAGAGLGSNSRGADLGVGVALALGAAASFGVALVLTQHEVADVDGRYRTAITMSAVGTLALVVELANGGLHWPRAAVGWWGLAALCVLYGCAITALFTVLPRLGVAGNSPILNFEPVAALLLAWLVLHQRMAPLQLGGIALVVIAVLALGLRPQWAFWPGGRRWRPAGHRPTTSVAQGT
jgi:drug/metabolite transporter (DMT)-like permease